MTQASQILATSLFGAAILHTFLCARIRELEHRTEGRSGGRGMATQLLRLLSEVEVVFGLWAALFVVGLGFTEGYDFAIRYVSGTDFTEAIFVAVVMAMAATRSIRSLATRNVELLARGLARLVPRLGPDACFYFVALTLGPLLGSLITEPAAMTVVALMLKDRFFGGKTTDRFRYKTLALLFVNVSIGGVLTHFAAPPVVLVSRIWKWDTAYVFAHFGWKAAIAVVLNACFGVWALREELGGAPGAVEARPATRSTPAWVTAIHLLFLALVILTGHYVAVFVGLFLLFLGVASVTEPHQDRIQLRESLLVGFFLAGIVLLGRPQGWWLAPLVSLLGHAQLLAGAAALTAVIDNAALTYLGAQIPGLTETLRQALVSGAVVGGGLTLIANAPNPVGYGVLKEKFRDGEVSPGRLLVAALVPTAIAALCLGVF